jgi:hypothetical protein
VVEKQHPYVIVICGNGYTFQNKKIMWLVWTREERSCYVFFIVRKRQDFLLQQKTKEDKILNEAI